MRIAALYDIHGNLPALEAVLADVARAGVDRLVVGGDVVPGPMPAECLARLRALDTPIERIQGNGEVAVLAVIGGGDPGRMPESARDAVRWVAGELSPSDAAFIASWPKTTRVTMAAVGAASAADRQVLFCHATPRNEFEIFTSRTPEARLRPIFDAAGAPLVVCGHTHMPFDRQIGDVRVVNAGSVGMPFGPPGADWLLLGSGVELRHTTYDLEDAARRIRATRYPQAQEFAARDVLQPRSAQEMLALLGKAELQ